MSKKKPTPDEVQLEQFYAYNNTRYHTNNWGGVNHWTPNSKDLEIWLKQVKDYFDPEQLKRYQACYTKNPPCQDVLLLQFISCVYQAGYASGQRENQAAVKMVLGIEERDDD